MKIFTNTRILENILKGSKDFRGRKPSSKLRIYSLSGAPNEIRICRVLTPPEMEESEVISCASRSSSQIRQINRHGIISHLKWCDLQQNSQVKRRPPSSGSFSGELGGVSLRRRVNIRRAEDIHGFDSALARAKVQPPCTTRSSWFVTTGSIS